MLTVPATSLALVSGGVAGRCFKGRPVTMLTYDATGAGPQDWDLTTADADGLWTADTALNAGWIVKVWCATAKGDVVLRTLMAN